MNHNSTLSRQEILANITTQTYDLVVVGGGITGAGIALDAASRGLKVALFEKEDFASGTSSKSTKLIHGGLRYLKQLEIGLVRETGTERAILHKLAPHLVLPEKMLLPLIKEGTYGKSSTSFGLAVYDFLAGVKREDRRKMLNVEETLSKEPLLRKEVVVGGGYYAEYRTDDARLTIELIKTAAQLGASSLNYMAVQHFTYDNQHKVNGVQVHDRLTGNTYTVKTNYIISAAGPWVDELRKADNSLQGKHLFPSKGVHIVVPHDKFPVQQAVYFDVPDGRMIFAIPRHRTTYIGTTDTPYQGDLNHVLTTSEDVAYLLESVNSMFPQVDLTIQDVESSWAGLRPLIFEPGKSASQMSRKDEIFESESGLISIAGGKLTGYRKMAERVVNKVALRYQQQFGKKIKPSQTQYIKLAGGQLPDSQAVKNYYQSILQQLQTLGLAPYQAAYLVSNYGKQTDLILEQMLHLKGDVQERLACAELWFTIQEEWVQKPLDFFNRRTGRLYFDMPSIHKVQEAVLQYFKNYFHWTDAQLAEERATLEAAMYEVSHFEEAHVHSK
ncbi:MAG: glycerol-3-phosphate dehydrogenase/oxidase [Saprospiraceae bacterium]|nr:glycerol-3-phosphate dehydrogenase/oxidase [Saprospiraceae bacterium]